MAAWLRGGVVAWLRQENPGRAVSTNVGRRCFKCRLGKHVDLIIRSQSQDNESTNTSKLACLRSAFNAQQSRAKVASPEGLEPPTSDLEGRCSIQLSYGLS